MLDAVRNLLIITFKIWYHSSTWAPSRS